MEVAFYKEMYNLENYHWWFLGKKTLLCAFLAKYADLKNHSMKILDVGCGTGMIMFLLKNYGETYGIDISEEALNFCRLRGHKYLKKARANNVPFDNQFFDLVIAFDLLEHLEDDEGAVKEFYRILKKGGILLISVPSFKFLYSEHDLAAGHKRRYTANQIKRLMKQKQFSIMKITYTNMFIFPLVVVYRLLKKFFPIREQVKTDFFSVPLIINKILSSIYRLEAILLARMDFPFGLSVVCVVRK